MEVDGGTEASKTSAEIKILCWEDLWSWIAAIWLTDLDENHKEDICLFRAMLEELQEVIKVFTFYTERAPILTPILLHHRKKNKRIWCLEPLSKEEQSIRKRAF